MPTAVLMVSGKDPLEELGGGHTTYVRSHARAALAAGFEPHIFGLGRDTGTKETDYGFVHRRRAGWALPRGEGLGIRGQSIPFHAGALAAMIEDFGGSRTGDLLLHSFGLWAWAGAKARRRLTLRGLRVAHAVSGYGTYQHELQAKVTAAGQEYGLRRRLWEHGELLFSRLVTNRYERSGFRDADVIFYNYESVRTILQDRHQPSALLIRLPYTSESAFTRAAASAAVCRPVHRDHPPRIVTVSRHDARKGLSPLLQALALVAARGQGFSARLVGSGHLIGGHRRLAAGLGLTTVELPGFVPDAFAELEEADIFVLPSLEEGSGSLSLIEAMQAGLAIVASSCDGIPEDVTDGHDALLVPPGDVSALADALSRLLADPSLRLRLGREARATFERRFAVTPFVNAISKAYANLGFRP